MSSIDTNVPVDEKIVNRIKKLLNLSRDGGATEHEANTAMEMAEQIMLANNLSMAQIELSGGGASESRGKTQTKGKANYRWQRWLMTTIAEANFCHIGVITGKRKIRHGYRDIALGYELIGRVSNVTAAHNMYDYLLQTCSRLRGEYEMQLGNTTADGALFVEGLAQRLAERVKERHEHMLAEQRKEAERQRAEQAARASHPSAAPTGNALVVILADYEVDERDANEDIRKGVPPGTTAAKRKEREAREAERDRRIKALAETVGYDVAWYMVHMGWSRTKAEQYQAQQEREAEEEAKKGNKRRWSGGGQTREDRLRDRLYTGAAAEGRRAGDKVSLSTQVGHGSKDRRLS